jgi:hypothetical protein
MVREIVNSAVVSLEADNEPGLLYKPRLLSSCWQKRLCNARMAEEIFPDVPRCSFSAERRVWVPHRVGARIRPALHRTSRRAFTGVPTEGRRHL